MRERLGDLPLLAQGPAAARRRRPRGPPAGLPLVLRGPCRLHADDGGESVISGGTRAAPGLLLAKQGSLMTSASGCRPPSSGDGGTGCPTPGGRLAPLLAQPSHAGGGSLAAAASDAASMALVGAYASRRKSVLRQPDHIKLPEEYLKVRRA